MYPTNDITRDEIPLHAEGGDRLWLLHHVWNDDACARMRARIDTIGCRPTGSLYPAGYRDNDRLVLDDVALADALYHRVRDHLPQRFVDDDGHAWRLHGLNARFRICRYAHGQSFTRHRDGAHTDGAQRSWFTLQLYLNDADAFVGGHTRFFANRTSDVVQHAVRPTTGSAVVFAHTLWHDGEAVPHGTKLVLRTDVLYVPDAPVTTTGHSGYVWALAPLPDGRIVSASRDRTLRIWRPGDDDALACEGVWSGHHASVTAVTAVTTVSASSGGTTRVCSGDRDGVLRGWLADGTPVWRDRVHDGAVLAMACTRGGDVISGGGDGCVVVTSAGGAPRARARVHDGWVWAVCVDDDGGLWSAGADGCLLHHTRDLASTTVHARFDAPLTCLVRTTTSLVVGDEKGRVHEQRSGSSSWRTLAAHDGAVRALGVDARGRIVSGGEDDVARVWEDARCVHVQGHGDFVRAVCGLADGSVVSAGYDGRVRRWRV